MPRPNARPASTTQNRDLCLLRITSRARGPREVLAAAIDFSAGDGCSMIVSVESYSQEQLDAAMRLIQRLAESDDRRDANKPRRRFARRRYHRVISIQRERGSAAATEPPSRCHVLARNISQGGLSFVYPGRLNVQKLLVSPSGPGSEHIWFRAEIVRVREVDAGFWEYGVGFRGRVEVP